MDWLSYLLGILGHGCCSVFPCFSNLDGFEVIPRNFIPCPQVDWYFLMMRLGAGLLGGEPQKKSTVFLTAPPGSIWPACPVAVDAGLGRLARGSVGSLRCSYTATPPPHRGRVSCCWAPPTVKAGLCSLSRGQNIYRHYLESFFKTHFGIVLYVLHIYCPWKSWVCYSNT